MNKHDNFISGWLAGYERGLSRGTTRTDPIPEAEVAWKNHLLHENLDKYISLYGVPPVTRTLRDWTMLQEAKAPVALDRDPVWHKPLDVGEHIVMERDTHIVRTSPVFNVKPELTTEALHITKGQDICRCGMQCCTECFPDE